MMGERYPETGGGTTLHAELTDLATSGHPDSIITFSDNTTGNATASAHGYLPKLSNSATQYLNGQGSWASVSGGDTYVYKTTNESFTSVAYTSISDLVFSFAANSCYLVEIYMYSKNLTAGNTSVSLRTLSTQNINPCYYYATYMEATSDTHIGDYSTANETTQTFMGANTIPPSTQLFLTVRMVFYSGTAGNMSLQLGNSQANAHTVGKGSFIKYRKLS